jgi:threonine/homoserine/homoserine lactone efflux protein
MPNFFLFLATSMAITLAPGPDNLQVLARGISQGRAAGLVAALGFAAGITFHTTLATLGVAALLRSSPLAFPGDQVRRCRDLPDLDRHQGAAQPGARHRT